MAAGRSYSGAPRSESWKLAWYPAMLWGMLAGCCTKLPLGAYWAHRLAGTVEVNPHVPLSLAAVSGMCFAWSFRAGQQCGRAPLSARRLVVDALV